MRNTNLIIVVGNTGSDAEMRYTPSGKAVANFSLACSSTYTKSDGEQVKDVQWFTVTCWDKLAELMNQFLVKGKKVIVTGRVSLRTWESQDGQNRSRMEINARDVEMLDRKPEDAVGLVEEVGVHPTDADAGVTADDLPFD